jgi:hypothetical protein
VAEWKNVVFFLCVIFILLYNWMMMGPQVACLSFTYCIATGKGGDN